MTDERFFAMLAEDLQTEPDLRQTVIRAASYARSLLGTDDAVIRFHRASSPGLARVAATSAQAENADDLRMLHRAPGASRRDPARIIVADTATDSLYPGWSRSVLALGYGSALTVRLDARRHSVGLLTVFSEHRGDFSSTARRLDFDALDTLVRHMAVALFDLRAAVDFDAAIESRTVIGQAQGILMERHGLDPSRSFEVLRRHSQQGNVKLTDVARQLVDSGELPRAESGRTRSAADGAAGRGFETPASA
jgi:hypothetical protein